MEYKKLIKFSMLSISTLLIQNMKAYGYQVRQNTQKLLSQIRSDSSKYKIKHLLYYSKTNDEVGNAIKNELKYSNILVEEDTNDGVLQVNPNLTDGFEELNLKEFESLQPKASKTTSIILPD